jgi:hypothetical protein
MEANGEHYTQADLLPSNNRCIECSADIVAARIGRHAFGEISAPWNRAILENTAFHGISQHFMVFHNISQHFTAFYGISHHFTEFHNI